MRSSKPKKITFVQYSDEEEKYFTIYINGKQIFTTEHPIDALLTILESLDIEVLRLGPEDIDICYSEGQQLPELERDL